MTKTSRRLFTETDSLAAACEKLRFSPPATNAYHPLIYARESHRRYLQKFAAGKKRVLFVGMNPGPWGMAQTGIPFGEIAAAKEWMQISAPVSAPPDMHPARPVSGFACRRSEASGRRLWGMFAAKYPRAEDFFAAHFVLNYCPVLFLSAHEKKCINITPDKLCAADREPLFAICDNFLRAVADILQPEFCIGVGGFAENRLRFLFADSKMRIGKILHPSPANPSANRGFAAAAEKQLRQIGVWE